MANLLDYLDWRGDLTLEQAPFNEVDNLILAELSFVDFKGIVPPPWAFWRRPPFRICCGKLRRPDGSGI